MIGKDRGKGRVLIRDHFSSKTTLQVTWLA
jgi:hypothetical protein